MSATTTPLPEGTDIAETIGGKVFNRAILYDQAGSPAQMYPDTQPVSAETLPLPEGAASETTLAAASAKLPASLGQKAANASLSIVPATGASFSISAAALPLPTGAATAEKQDEAATAIAALTSQGPAFAITPHATDPLEREIGGISVVTGGTIIYRYPGETEDRPIEVGPGMYPLRATHIRTGTTAGGLTGW